MDKVPDGKHSSYQQPDLVVNGDDAYLEYDYYITNEDAYPVVVVVRIKVDKIDIRD